MTIPEIPTPADDVDPSTPAEVSPADVAADPPAPVDPSTPPPADDNDDLEAIRRKGRENKNLRERLQTADAERDAARAELDVLRRQAVERIVAGELRDVRDFADKHPELDEFLGDDGQLDAAAVLAAAQALAAERPHYAAPPAVTAPPSIRPIESLRPGASPPATPAPGASWDTVLGRAIPQPALYVD